MPGATKRLSSRARAQAKRFDPSAADEAVTAGGGGRKKVAAARPATSSRATKKRAASASAKKKPWTKTEDQQLRSLVTKNTTKNESIRWTIISRSMNGRSSKQCRERWHNNLRPDLKKSAWTPEESALIVRLQAELGNQWSKIAAQLPGRSDNDVKNRWHSTNRTRSKAPAHSTNRTRSNAKGKKGVLTDVTNTPQKKPARVVLCAPTATEEGGLEAQPTSPLTMTPTIGTMSPIIDQDVEEEPSFTSPAAFTGQGDDDASPKPPQPLPELGLPTIDIDPSLAASNDIINPHFFAALEEIATPPESMSQDGIVTALLSSLSPNATRVLPSSEGLKSPEMLSLEKWSGPPTEPADPTKQYTYAQLPDNLHLYQPAPVNFSIAGAEDKHGPIAFV